MKKLLLISTAVFTSTVFLAWTACNAGKKTKVIDKWDNGKSKVVLTYDNPDDTVNYIREYFHENGQLGSKGRFILDKQDGFWEWWYENGNKQDEATFKNGSYIKERKHWREDGTLEQIEIIEGECMRECCDGKEIHYTEKGTKLIEYTRQNGQRNGGGLSFFPNGKVKTKFTYVNGLKNGKWLDYFMNGQIAHEGNYVNDKEDGLWLTKDSVGNILEKYSYVNGELNGMNYVYYPNGQLQVEGKYVDGKAEGKWTWTNSDGIIEGYKIYMIIGKITPGF